MVMPTYYTPTEQDLVWGLEYEILNSYNQWICAQIKCMDDIKSFFWGGFSKSRIKHLDEDDIIELGWELTYEQKPPFELKEFIFGEDYKLFITDWKDVTICSIEHKGMEDEYLDTMFFGKLPNKAELKRLMNNLQISNK